MTGSKLLGQSCIITKCAFKVVYSITDANPSLLKTGNLGYLVEQRLKTPYYTTWLELEAKAIRDDVQNRTAGLLTLTDRVLYQLCQRLSIGNKYYCTSRRGE
jgi:hypothetical protein